MSIHQLRQRARSEKGFTLIELLVVILIIGILTAIALPAFLNQREKAQDAGAKSLVRNAQTAMETYYNDNQDYSTATKAKLVAIEPSLNDDTLVVTPISGGYTLQATSKSKRVWKMIKPASGAVTRTCTAPTGAPACPTADASGNQW